MRLWPTSAKDRRIKKLEATVDAFAARIYEVTTNTTAEITVLRKQLDRTEQYRSNWKEKHAKLSKAHVKLQKAHGLRGRKIKELKGIINQMEERQRGKLDDSD